MNRFVFLFIALLGCFAQATTLNFTALELGEYSEQVVEEVTYGIYHAPIEHVSLHWQDEEGKAYGSLGALKKALIKYQRPPILLMNAGIYTDDYQPAGLWIERGQTLRSLNTNDGAGNFHLKPNGVFFIDDNQAQILTTAAYAALNLQPQFALQSGPMLVIDGHINSRFIADIDSPYKRNGVCVTDKAELYFVMSIDRESSWPNLYHFAQALQSFGCQQALYLDGSISAWYIKDISKAFHWHTFVGIIAVTSH